MGSPRSFVGAFFSTLTRYRVNALSFVIVVVCLCAAIGVAAGEARSASRLRSTILAADAARIRSDALVSAAVLASLLGVRLGFPLVDPLVSVIVAAIIAWTAPRIVQGASRVLVDAAVGDTREIAKAARSVAALREYHQVRARGIGGMVRVDLHTMVDPQMTVAESHELAERVERRIRQQVGGITEVLVHVGASNLHP